MAKVTKEKFKTKHNVFDDFTNRTLFKLISQRHFEGLIGPVSIGKESNVFTAKKEEGRVIVKIYRLETADFNKMYDYIRDDPRFISLRKQRRKIIFAWGQREYRNLINARDAGLNVPLPITFLNNVLVMGLIGNQEPAPKLKDAIPRNKKRFFNEIIENIKKLNTAGYVHSDLSHFNILNHDERPVFIDFSHMTPLKNPNSKEYLERDVRNICNFFNKIRLKTEKEKIMEKLKA